MEDSKENKKSIDRLLNTQKEEDVETAKNAIIWIDELLTTKHKQDTNRLGDTKNGFCCLGLGCHILNIEFDPEDDASDFFKDAVGLASIGGMDINLEHDSLIALNDDMSYTFKLIGEQLKAYTSSYFKKDVAKLIEEHYKEN